MPGLIWASDGVCRPFADAAAGTVPADGACLVVLTTARAAPGGRGFGGYAYVDGVGINNDGARKSGFSQPSGAGQEEVMASGGFWRLLMASEGFQWLPMASGGF